MTRPPADWGDAFKLLPPPPALNPWALAALPLRYPVRAAFPDPPERPVTPPVDPDPVP